MTDKIVVLISHLLVETDGLEPLTSTMSTWRSSQLGYASIKTQKIASDMMRKSESTNLRDRLILRHRKTDDMPF